MADGIVEKYKARFVARGFSQVDGIDYDETFAPVARYTSIMGLISIATEMGWKIHQMDVKTAFLNGIIQEEIYIEQPQGFEIHERVSCLQVEEGPLWAEASSKSLVLQD